MTVAAWLGAGALFALIALLAAARLGRRSELGLLAAVVAIYALYAGMAIGAPAPVLALETAIAAAGILTAVYGWSRRVLVLPALLAAHAGVDAGHLIADGTVAPEWYAMACISADLLLAAGALALLRSYQTREGH